MIHWVASLARPSVACLDRCGRLACQRILSGTSSKSSRGRPPAASLARPSMNSLPATPLCAGTHMTETSLFLAARRVPTSMVTLSHCWPGPRASAMARQIAGRKSEKIVYLWSVSCLASKIFNAYMANASASKASLLLPRWERLPVQPSRVLQPHAAPTLPLPNLDPSIQMVPWVLQSRAVSRAGPWEVGYVSTRS